MDDGATSMLEDEDEHRKRKQCGEDEQRVKKSRLPAAASGISPAAASGISPIHSVPISKQQAALERRKQERILRKEQQRKERERQLRQEERARHRLKRIQNKNRSRSAQSNDGHPRQKGQFVTGRGSKRIKSPYHDISQLITTARISFRNVKDTTVVGWNGEVSFYTSRGNHTFICRGKIRNFLAASGLFAERFGQHFDPFLGFSLQELDEWDEKGPGDAKRVKKERQYDASMQEMEDDVCKAQPIIVYCHLKADALKEIERFGDALIRHFGFRAFRTRKYLGTGALHTSLDERTPPEFPPVANRELWTPANWTPRAPATSSSVRALPFVVRLKGEVRSNPHALVHAAIVLRVYSDGKQLPNFVEMALAKMASQFNGYTRIGDLSRRNIMQLYPFLLGYGADMRLEMLVKRLGTFTRPRKWLQNAHIVHRLATYAVGPFYAVLLTGGPKLHFRFLSMVTGGQGRVCEVQRVPITKERFLDSEAYTFEAMLSAQRNETDCYGNPCRRAAKAVGLPSADAVEEQKKTDKQLWKRSIPRLRTSQHFIEDVKTDTWDYILTEEDKARDPFAEAQRKLAAMRVGTKKKGEARQRAEEKETTVEERNKTLTIKNVVPLLTKTSPCGCFVSTGTCVGEDTVVAVRNLQWLDTPSLYLQLPGATSIAFVKSRKKPESPSTMVAVSHVQDGILLFRLSKHRLQADSSAVQPKEILVDKLERRCLASLVCATKTGDTIVGVQAPDNLLIWDMNDKTKLKVPPNSLAVGPSFVGHNHRRKRGAEELTASSQSKYARVPKREASLVLRMPPFPLPEDSAEYREAGLAEPYDSDDDDEEALKREEAMDSVAAGMTIMHSMKATDTDALVMAFQKYRRRSTTVRADAKARTPGEETKSCHGMNEEKEQEQEQEEEVTRLIWAMLPLDPASIEEVEWNISKETDVTHGDISIKRNRVVVGSRSGAISVYKALNGSRVCRVRDSGPKVHSVSLDEGSNLILASFDAEEGCKLCRAATFAADSGATVWEHSTEHPVYLAIPSPTLLSHRVTSR